jgi:hypothetical protein
MNWVEKAPFSPAGYQMRVFQATAEDGHLSVFVGKEPLGPGGQMQWHLSISHRSSLLVGINGNPLPGRIPTWDEIKDARYRFCPDEVYMAMILPPKAEYVNLHPTTMHLHEIEG